MSTILDRETQTSVATKVMLRMDRKLRRRGVRSYRGYEQRGCLYARLRFDDCSIDVGPFGALRRLVVC